MSDTCALTEADKQRFWSHVQRGEPSACWPWLARLNKDGYPHWGVNRKNGNKSRKLKVYSPLRIIYGWTHRLLKADEVVTHTCGSKICCNVDHMKIITRAESARETTKLVNHRNAPPPSSVDKNTGLTQLQIQAFNALIKKGEPGACWPWMGSKNEAGYGRWGARLATGKWKIFGAHRLAFIIGGGILDETAPFVCHQCDNPSCANFRHLFASTHQGNMTDMVKKGRHCHGPTHISVTRPEVICRGIESGMAVLNDDKVREIRRIARSGSMTRKELAAEFNVCLATIRDVVKRRTWKHVV